MPHPFRPVPPPRSRFRGALVVGAHTWEVYFLDVARVGSDWLIDCAVIGPYHRSVTIHCRAEANHSDTARRVMEALRQWLLSGDSRPEAYLEVPEALGKAC